MPKDVRKRNRDKFWSWIDGSIRGYSEAIEMLLNMLTDEQLDQLIAEITEAGGFGDDDDSTDID